MEMDSLRPQRRLPVTGWPSDCGAPCQWRAPALASPNDGSCCLSDMLYAVCAVHSAGNTVSLLSRQFSPFKSRCLPDSHQDSARKNHFLPRMCLHRVHVGAAMCPHSHHGAGVMPALPKVTVFTEWNSSGSSPCTGGHACLENV